MSGYENLLFLKYFDDDTNLSLIRTSTVRVYCILRVLAITVQTPLCNWSNNRKWTLLIEMNCIAPHVMYHRRPLSQTTCMKSTSLLRIQQHEVQMATWASNMRFNESYWFFFHSTPGDIEVLQNLLIDGYDHILDASDKIMSVARSHGHPNIAKFLEGITEFEVWNRWQRKNTSSHMTHDVTCIRASTLAKNPVFNWAIIQPVTVLIYYWVLESERRLSFSQHSAVIDYRCSMLHFWFFFCCFFFFFQSNACILQNWLAGCHAIYHFTALIAAA